MNTNTTIEVSRECGRDAANVYWEMVTASRDSFDPYERHAEWTPCSEDYAHLEAYLGRVPTPVERREFRLSARCRIYDLMESR